MSIIKVRPLIGKEWDIVNWNGDIGLPNFKEFFLPVEDLPLFNREEKIQRIKEIDM